MRKKKNQNIFSQVDTSNIDLDQIVVDVESVDPGVGAENTGHSQKGNDLQENGADSDQNADHQIPAELGILALRNAIVFPGTVMPLAVGRPKSRSLLEQTLPQGKTIGVLAQIDSKTDDPQFDDLYQVGSVVSLLKMLKMPDGQNSLVVHGLTRFRVVKWRKANPYLLARIEVLTSGLQPGKELDATVNSIRQMAHQIIQLTPNIPEEVSVVINNI
ncbi:MAG: LON peptidase substrate-binding domain-containing protein, partial [Planctomycetes bacterium]|nr:LON peptidase substrate-binding domain-containing protein [Planctomycetota bacterium]